MPSKLFNNTADMFYEHGGWNTKNIWLQINVKVRIGRATEQTVMDLTFVSSEWLCHRNWGTTESLTYRGIYIGSRQLLKSLWEVEQNASSSKKNGHGIRG